MLAEEMNRVKDGFNEATNAPTDLDLAKVSENNFNEDGAGQGTKFYIP